RALLAGVGGLWAAAAAVDPRATKAATSSALQVPNQTLAFGALTLRGAGAVAPVPAAGAISSATIVGGGDGQWAIAADGKLTRRVDAVPPAQVLHCLFNGNISAVVSIDIVPERYSVANSSELAQLLLGGDALVNGKGVLYRAGRFTFPNLY